MLRSCCEKKNQHQLITILLSNRHFLPLDIGDDRLLKILADERRELREMFERENQRLRQQDDQLHGKLEKLQRQNDQMQGELGKLHRRNKKLQGDISKLQRETKALRQAGISKFSCGK